MVHTGPNQKQPWCIIRYTTDKKGFVLSEQKKYVNDICYYNYLRGRRRLQVFTKNIEVLSLIWDWEELMGEHTSLQKFIPRMYHEIRLLRQIYHKL